MDMFQFHKNFKYPLIHKPPMSVELGVNSPSPLLFSPPNTPPSQSKPWLTAVVQAPLSMQNLPSNIRFLSFHSRNVFKSKTQMELPIPRDISPITSKYKSPPGN